MEAFAKLWGEEKKDREKQRKFWDGRALEFNSKLFNVKTNSEVEEVITFLEKKGALKEDSSVIDIGCGPGKYTMAFAKKVDKVTATDISLKMIDFGKENAQNNRIHNVQFAQTSWAEADLSVLGWRKKYNLVFASFCPGIDSATSLKKMVEASKEHCFMSHFVTREEEIFDQLKKHFGLKKSTWGKQIYYSFNLLWHWGYFPEIIYLDRCRQTVSNLEDTADLFISRIDEPMTFTRQDVLDYLKRFSDDGKIQETMLSKVAWMYWKI